MRTWVNVNSVCFVVGLGLAVFGIYGIYQPAAAIAAGAVMMTISVFGTHRMVRK